MIKHNIRVFTSSIIGLAFLTYAIIFFFTQNLDNINFNKALNHISTTITINFFLWSIFIKWAWKFNFFHPWLVQIPNLEGNWKGFLNSNWEGSNPAPIPIEVKINQSFLNIQVVIKTNEMRSYSFGAAFDIDKERGYEQLVYSYLSTPDTGIRNRSEIHYGTALLNFEGTNIDLLKGEYWTSRKTTGAIELRRIKD